MRQSKSGTTGTVLGLTILACLAGCATGPAVRVASEPLHYGGRVEQVLVAPLPRVHGSAVRVLAGLDLPVLEERTDRLSGLLVSRNRDGDPVRIETEALGDTYTRVTVRVGYEGEEQRSLDLLHRIRAGAAREPASTPGVQ